MMRIAIDVVIANCTMTLDELNHLQTSQIKPVNDFVQSEVLLKSGNELIATGTLIKVDDLFYVSIEQVNNISQ
ncbi:FliM/FliN family flagellar motor switch protein [Shewanella oncorhynchi]|nr:FliM/FliN family flagellar motor switch protein [Shewanella oncorhynchi]